MLTVCALIASEVWGLSIGRMTTNGRINPLGIGGDDLSLGWVIESETRGTVQRAYQVRVGTAETESTIWDSGRVESDRQVDIPIPAEVRLQPATRYAWQVRVWDGAGLVSPWSTPAWFETGLTSEAWSNARWIKHAASTTEENKVEPPSLPLLRRVITLTKPIRSARLYASAHGLYQLSLNGEKLGDQFLAPGWTDYSRRLQSQTYDATSLLRAGENVIGAALADGWYRGKVGIGWRQIYGDTLSLIAKLRVAYEDGTVEEFATDENWRTSEGPFVEADLQDGETYDARREQPGWSHPGFDASAWRPAVVTSDEVRALVAQPDEPIRVIETRMARTRAEPSPGAFIYDFGQNLVGVVRVQLKGRAGQTVRFRYAEELNRVGESRGRMYTDNFRSARVTDTYTFARDEAVVYQPTFTQHGFRYVEITGVETAPTTAEVQAVVLGSDLPDTGDLRLSHPMLDQLVRNVRWGQRGNFLSIPTDTPARDERLGWTGDIAVFAPTASRYQDTRAFLSKWMDDVGDAQRLDGNIPAVVPQPRAYFDETGVGWSDAFISVPYAVWRATGDTRIIRRHWERMRRFYQLVHASATQDGNLIEEGRSSWFSGDWLNLENVDRLAEHRVIATAYFAENTRMMAEMAAAIGETSDAATFTTWVPQIRNAFRATFRKPNGSIETGTQTVYAMALGMDLITDSSERVQTAAKFVEKLESDNVHLKTGFLGTPWLLPALSKIGRDDLAMRLLLNEDYPSWGFEIRMGATTMWERWNSIRADGEFGPVDMNSFNHYAYGAVADWMFQHLGGVEILEPGYKRFRVAPLSEHPALNHAHCRLLTPHGLIVVEWSRDTEQMNLKVRVPANTSAEIVLPTDTIRAVQEGATPLSSAEGVVEVVADPRGIRAIVGSGHYAFVTTKKSDAAR